MNAQKIARTGAALLLGLGGGAVFSWIGIPLPWTLGSLAVAAVAALAGVDLALPELFRKLARPVIGVFAGSAFTLSVVVSMANWWPMLLFLAVFFFLITLLGYLFFTRVCGLDRATAYFASTPGGLGELSLLGGLYGGSMRALVVIHAIRIVSVVVAVPIAVQFLVPAAGPIGAIPAAGAATELAVWDWLLLTACAGIGYAVGRVFDIASAVILVPMVLSALVHVAGLTQGAPPGWLVAFVQVVIGSVCGARFAGIGLKEFRSTVVQGLVWAAFMLFAAFVFAWLAASFVDAPFPALVLAFSPGGFAEVTIIAFAIGIEVAFVVACHVFRTFFVLVVAPPGYHLVRQTGSGPPQAT